MANISRAFEMRLAEHMSGSSIESNDVSEQQRTALIGLKSHGKRATVGYNRTGSAILGTNL